MCLKICFCVVIYIAVQLDLTYSSENKKHSPYNITKQNQRFENPNFVKDRFKVIVKPEMPEVYKNRHRPPYNPAWMDYCDPYHCNDYHKTACGLNRNNMKFKWFQSACHVILNNMCAHYRGVLKYDMVETKYCMAYVMLLRTGCQPCRDDVESPVCAMSVTDFHAVRFKNKCALKMANCEPATLDEYKPIEMKVCTLFELMNMGIQPYHPRVSRILL